MTGDSAALAAALKRFEGLYPDVIHLSLGRVEAALEALGRPQDRLPPVIHVAGTNGKGSTSAFMRAMAEAAGLKVDERGMISVDSQCCSSVDSIFAIGDCTPGPGLAHRATHMAHVAAEACAGEKAHLHIMLGFKGSHHIFADGKRVVRHYG